MRRKNKKGVSDMSRKTYTLKMVLRWGGGKTSKIWYNIIS